jgi:serine/threonine protein phosphatase PrpC
MRWQVATVSEVGPHPQLEDRFLIERLGDTVVAAVADGAGGISGAARAAQLAIDTIREAFARLERLDSSDAWAMVLRDADQRISQDGEAGETTGVVVAASPEKVVGASVGDSGAFVLGDHGTHELSQNQIIRPFLGSGLSIPIGFDFPQLKGTLLVASDGLVRRVDMDAVRRTAVQPDLDLCALNLVELVRSLHRMLPDDLTAILIRS